MAIAVMPDPPKSRWARIGDIAFLVVLMLIVALFVYSMIEAWIV
ncbi:MAG TPA: hypothetical protein VHF23_01100 [Gaiellaceae bacterium]|nr:hypothetical protein [Gaiellaceae bacterium]